MWWSWAGGYRYLKVDVQTAQVYADQKTFVDATPNGDPAAILASYRAQRGQPGFSLKDFVDAHFEPPADTPVDPPAGQALREHIAWLWPALTRTTADVPRVDADDVRTAKHGGVNHVLVDFDTSVLSKLSIGDQVQVYSCGLGLALPDYPEITLTNCAPSLLRRWNPTPRGRGLELRATHIVAPKSISA